jgi:hypothetical protein
MRGPASRPATRPVQLVDFIPCRSGPVVGFARATLAAMFRRGPVKLVVAGAAQLSRPQKGPRRVTGHRIVSSAPNTRPFFRALRSNSRNTGVAAKVVTKAINARKGTAATAMWYRLPRADRRFGLPPRGVRVARTQTRRKAGDVQVGDVVACGRTGPGGASAALRSAWSPGVR